MTPWKKGGQPPPQSGHSKRWLARRGGGEAAEIRQAVEQVRLFIEQYGESRFDPLDVADSRPANNRAGWRRIRFNATMVDPAGDLEIGGVPRPRPNVVARTLAERQMLKRAKEDFSR